MANLEYKILPLFPEQVTDVKRFSTKDVTLFGDFKVNNLFKSTNHMIELHAYSQAGQLLKSDYSFKGYSFLATAAGAGKDGESALTLDPVKDSIDLGYTSGQVNLLYNFLNNLYSPTNLNPQFYIESISRDRRELRLLTTQLSDEFIKRVTINIKSALNGESYFSDFRLNFLNNNLTIGINIDVEEYRGQQAVLVRLYEPLPSNIDIKATCTICEVVSDSLAFEVVSSPIAEEEQFVKLAEPNFDVDVEDLNGTPSPFFNINELFSFPVTGSYYELMSLANESGSAISIDHSDYSEFIHFSSAEERVRNFKYKLQLIEGYSGSIATLKNQSSNNADVTGSIEYYETQIKGVVNNFDHYDRFLYYESSSLAWPKSTERRPYELVSSSNALATSWFTDNILSASNYDKTNVNNLENSIPSFIREDSNNSAAITFTSMLGQHFDNIWIYQKALSKRYDTDHRLNHGISRDLVGDALRAFGAKIYSTNESLENLFSLFTGEEYTSQSILAAGTHIKALDGNDHEAHLQPMPAASYKQEVYKRLYHNLPLLTKSKGTERALRALINCYGVPNDILTIRTTGNIDKSADIYLSPEYPISSSYNLISSSFNNIDIDRTGSLIPGETLASNTSIRRVYSRPTNVNHSIEVGFSPADNENLQIYASASVTGSFNIDDFIGDPTDSYESSYSSLDDILRTYFQDNSAYNVRDFVNLIRFFDNSLFKSIKDYIPARANADVGIIIKPNVLSRSKAKLVSASFEQPEYTGSISLVEISGSDGGIIQDSVYLSSSLSGSTNYLAYEMTVSGSALSTYHNHGVAEFDGEYSGSQFVATDGDLTKDNVFRKVPGVNLRFDIETFDASFICDFQVALFSFPTPTPTRTPSITPSKSHTASVTPSISTTNTATPSISTTSTTTATPSISTTNTRTATPSLSLTNTATATPSISTTNTTTATPSVTPTRTPVESPTPTRTVTPTVSTTNTRTATPSISTTNTRTATPSISTTNTRTATPSISTTNTRTATPSRTRTPSISTTNTRTATPSISTTNTRTATPSISTTNTKSATPSRTPSKSTINHAYSVTLYRELTASLACEGSSSATVYMDSNRTFNNFFNSTPFPAIYASQNSNSYALGGIYSNGLRYATWNGPVWSSSQTCIF